MVIEPLAESPASGRETVVSGGFSAARGTLGVGAEVGRCLGLAAVDRGLGGGLGVASLHEGLHCRLDICGGVRGRELHADAGRAVWHDREAERHDVDAVLQHPICNT